MIGPMTVDAVGLIVESLLQFSKKSMLIFHRTISEQERVLR